MVVKLFFQTFSVPEAYFNHFSVINKTFENMLTILKGYQAESRELEIKRIVRLIPYSFNFYRTEANLYNRIIKFTQFFTIRN